MAAAKLKMDSGDSPALKEAMEELHTASEGGGGGGEPRAEERVIGDPITPPKDEPEIGEIAEPGQTRRQRHTNRYAEANEARLRAEERARVLEEQLAEARKQPQPVYHQPPHQQGHDPIAARLEMETQKLRQEHEDLVNTYNAKLQAGNLTPEEAKEHRERGWKLTERREELAAIRAMHKAGRLVPQQQQQLTPQQLVNMQLETQFPEVYRDEKLMKRAQLKYDELVLDGEPDSAATTAKALAWARDNYGTMRRPDPDESTRQRLTGIGSGARSGGGNGNGKQSITMTPDLIKMAVRAFPKLTRDQAVQKWANEAGPGYLDDIRNNGR